MEPFWLPMLVDRQHNDATRHKVQKIFALRHVIYTFAFDSVSTNSYTFRSVNIVQVEKWLNFPKVFSAVVLIKGSTKSKFLRMMCLCLYFTKHNKTECIVTSVVLSNSNGKLRKCTYSFY